ncbi:metallophosphoesterase family protein [Paenibacillus sedimenti]|uniref:Metallophosphoesterase n=1 Tax=Paenibacillus sedimenti TaxID=2770274 RepID=A0A926QKX3_9BACL|nr:metallophosphoesterase [Paenibacillus sedimenti]MBD0383020.1 metallophosphoesterase [Paenibacillus sedimenti]
MRQFDLISDVHLDFWVKETGSLWNLQRKLKKFVRLILPEPCSRTLLIAGDLGHNNKQNYLFLKLIKDYYANILLVLGNHDYYLDKSALQGLSSRDSMDRMKEMKLLASQLPGVQYLDGDMVEIDGVIYGGCGMWYDLQYGMQVLRASQDRIFKHWVTVSNDYSRIRGKPRLTLDMFQNEKTKLEKVLAASHVILTHVSPDWNQVPEGRVLDLSSSFYYFDGSPYMNHLSNKIWCFGHVHHRMDYVHHHCRFINASLGYPRKLQTMPDRIRTIII